MKQILIALALTFSLGSCISVQPDTLATDGPLGRQVQRLVSRHDDYVLGDDTLPGTATDAALAESAGLEALMGFPSVARTSLAAALEPVASRHDAYVRADPVLDELEREMFLATSDGLLRLVKVK